MKYTIFIIVVIFIFSLVVLYSIIDIHKSMFNNSNWVDVLNLRAMKSRMKKIKHRNVNSIKALQHKVNNLNKSLNPIIKYISHDKPWKKYIIDKEFLIHYSDEDHHKLKEIKKTEDVIKRMNSSKSPVVNSYESEINKIGEKRMGKFTVNDVLKEEKRIEDLNNDKDFTYKT